MQAGYAWTPLIAAHAAAALTAVVLGGVLLVGRKGHQAHRLAGWIWVMAMAFVAGVSFAIHGPGGWSWIHGLSAFTLVALAWGVLMARLHRVRSHRSTMVSMYIGALLITGLFTLLPGRLIGRAVWGWIG